MKDKIIMFLKIAISLGLMAILLYRFLSDSQDRELLLGYLTTANYWYLLLALIFYVIAVITNAIKWHILLKAQGVSVPLTALINYTFVGFFFNNFLPANVGGDVMRGFGLARYTERSADAAVSVIVDRIIGLLAFMFTAVVAAMVAVRIAPAGQNMAESLVQIEFVAIAGMVGIIIMFTVILSYRLRQFIGRIFDIKFLHPVKPLYERLSNAFGLYRYQYSALLWAFVVGVATVSLTGLVDIAIIAGLRGNISPIYIFLLNPIIAITLIAPISIGGLGTGSLLYVYFYGLVGVPETLSFALSLIKQAVVYIGSLPGGVLWLQASKKRADS